MAYTIYFRAYAITAVEHVSAHSLYAARLIWDALAADGANMVSTRP